MYSQQNGNEHVHQELFNNILDVCGNVALTTDGLQGFGCRLSDLIDQFLACLLCSLGLPIDRK